MRAFSLPAICGRTPEYRIARITAPAEFGAGRDRGHARRLERPYRYQARLPAHGRGLCDGQPLQLDPSCGAVLPAPLVIRAYDASSLPTDTVTVSSRTLAADNPPRQPRPTSSVPILIPPQATSDLQALAPGSSHLGQEALQVSLDHFGAARWQRNLLLGAGKRLDPARQHRECTARHAIPNITWGSRVAWRWRCSGGIEGLRGQRCLMASLAG